MVSGILRGAVARLTAVFHNLRRQSGSAGFDVARGCPDVAFLHCHPGLTAEDFETYTRGFQAIVLGVYATGCSPTRLNHVIRTRVESGVPVFFIAASSPVYVGIGKIGYGTQVEAMQAGAISLECLPIPEGDCMQVLTVVQAAIDAGKTGRSLAGAVRLRFAAK